MHLETGRFMGMEEEDRICHLCDLQEIENEIHFILYCPFYHSIRQNLFDKVDKNNEIIWFEDPERLPSPTSKIKPLKSVKGYITVI